MKGIVCSDLYSLDIYRTAGKDTVAIRELVDGARGAGLEIDAVLRFFPVLTRRGVFLPRRRSVSGLDVFDIPKIGFRFSYSEKLARMVLHLLGFRGTCDFAVCHTASNFEAVVRVLGRRVGARILVVHHSDFKRNFLEDMLRVADGVLARSPALEQRLRAYEGVNLGGVVFSGIDENDIIDIKTKNLSLSDGLKVVIACSLLPRKNVEPTLRALQRVSEKHPVSVDVFGEGPLHSRIRALVAQNKSKADITFHGFKPKSVVLEAMRTAHLFIMPSAPETFGVAYLEAMASGCVVVGHEGWGVDGIISSREGYLVNSAGVSFIEEAITDYLRSDRVEMHRRAWLLAREYTKVEAARNYKEKIEAIVLSGNGS